MGIGLTHPHRPFACTGSTTSELEPKSHLVSIYLYLYFIYLRISMSMSI